MASISFVLSPESVARLHGAITCLSKFDEDIGWQVGHDKLVLSSINTANTAAASITLSKSVFFQSHSYRNPDAGNSTFDFRILSKALLAVFKGRMVDVRDRETSIDSCEIRLQDGIENAESRMIVKMHCRHGVRKTYKLTYEVDRISRATFNPDTAENKWVIGAHILKAFSEYFGLKTEHIDFNYKDGRFLLTSYAEKVRNKQDVLRQPLQTSVTLDRLDFDEFNVQENIHVGISVKDFRSVIAHADSLRTSIEAQYSIPRQPLQLKYTEHGMICEFVFMTIDEYRGGSVNPTTVPIARSSERPSNTSQPPKQSRTVVSNAAMTSMPPPAHPASRTFARDPGSQLPRRPSPPPPQASINQDSLFLQDDDDEDERRWGDQNLQEDQDELSWDPGNVALRGSIKKDHTFDHTFPDDTVIDDDRGVPPTQRMSQVPGLFDD